MGASCRDLAGVRIGWGRVVETYVSSACPHHLLLLLHLCPL